MNANAILTAIRELKKTNPAEFAAFEKGYAEEMTEGVSFWSANCGYITLWKLQEGVEVSGCELEGASRLGDEWGCLSGISTRTITKKMVEREDFYEEESDDEEVGCSSCPKCETTYTQKQIDDGEVVPCNRCYKCFVGECGKDNCDCEPEEEPEPVKEPVETPVEAPISDRKKYLRTMPMRTYIKARMNYLMREAQAEYEDNREYGDNGSGVLFTRKEEWNSEEFDTLLCSLCSKAETTLNSYRTNNSFGVSAEMRKKGKKNADGQPKHWTVSVIWTNENEDPFEDLYDETEETLSDDEDDE